MVITGVLAIAFAVLVARSDEERSALMRCLSGQCKCDCRRQGRIVAATDHDASGTWEANEGGEALCGIRYSLLSKLGCILVLVKVKPYKL
jgi:hypothetical protein